MPETRTQRSRNGGTFTARLRWSVAMFGLLLASAMLAQHAHARQLTVFAAASLKNAIDEIVLDFEEATGHRVTPSYAGSATLARQIELGAPADLFISANTDWVDYLVERQRVLPESRFDLLRNTLVLIAHGRNNAPIEAHQDLQSRLEQGPLAIALVDAVPAGIYAKIALMRLDLWDIVKDRIAQTDNVRAVLAMVARGEAPLGIVYATDAQASDNVGIVYEFPADSHPPIRYPAVAVAPGGNPAAREFLDYLKKPSTREIFIRHGFRMAD